MDEFFHEPAQALARNIVVIALGFVPMFFATLVPYVTVGAFFFAIMIISGGATFLIMPATLSFYPARTIGGPGAARSARESEPRFPANREEDNDAESCPDLLA